MCMIMLKFNFSDGQTNGGFRQHHATTVYNPVESYQIYRMMFAVLFYSLDLYCCSSTLGSLIHQMWPIYSSQQDNAYHFSSNTVVQLESKSVVRVLTEPHSLHNASFLSSHCGKLGPVLSCFICGSDVDLLTET
jgi:hypothetical protein